MQKIKPIIIGEQIGDSKLFRRFQGETEIAPIYVKDQKETYTEAELNAQSEADRHGFHGVFFGDYNYGKLFGSWYVLDWNTARTKENYSLMR